MTSVLCLWCLWCLSVRSSRDIFQRVESEILASDPNKKIVLMLNKIDLVPQHVTEKWLAYFRQEFPCIAFKASTQKQATRLARVKGDAEISSQQVLAGSAAVGTDALLHLLKNYCRNRGIKTSVTVGVIGYPNVGKSSVINSLKRSRAVSVSSVAGHTKHLQEVTIDKNIKLLDCPGIIFDEDSLADAGDEEDQSEFSDDEDDDSNTSHGKKKPTSDAKEALLLRNCLTVNEVEDPVSAVAAILRRVPPRALLEIYQIGVFSNIQEFLVRIAMKRGKMKRGGKYDFEDAARSVLVRERKSVGCLCLVNVEDVVEL